jgi:phenylalanyl-tRNA synthetase beta chain
MEQLFALVTPDGQTVGSAGRIAAQGLDVPKWAGRLWCFELAIESTIRQPTRYQALPVYPAVDRDLALLVPVGTLSADVEAVIRDAAPGYLEWLTVFDVYEGDKIPVGTRSIAYRLRFRSPDRTLTDEGVDSAVQRITAALKEKLNVGIRGA